MKSNSIQKEKGTLKVPNSDSVKNHLQFTNKNNFFKKNSTTLIDKLLSDIQHNTAFLHDELEIRRHYSYISQLKHIKRVVLTDPRYPHIIVQKKIDNLYADDNQIKGVSVDFLFNEIKFNLENFNPHVRGLF